MCPHRNLTFRPSLDLPDEDHPLYRVRISARCSDCGRPMEWVGVGREPSETRPYVDGTGTELRVALRVVGSGKAVVH